MRYLVAAGVEPWAAAYQKLRADALASPTYAVRGNPTWTQVSRDGGVHASEFESDANAAYLQALMWIVTQDTRHAQKCVEIFNAWKNLTEVTGGGTAPLNAGLYAYKLVEAAEIIKSTYTGWAAADIQAFKAMLVYPGLSRTAVPASLSDTNGTFYWRIYNGDPGRHGNQDMIAWRAMIVMGVFLDDRIMFDRALRYFKGQTHRTDDLPYPSGPSPSGTQLDDNPYFTTYQVTRQSTTPDYGYNGVLGNYVWENGQCQEASRDQQHAFFGLGIAAGIADVAWNQGDGVWNTLDNRLLKGFEFMARYNVSYIASFPDQTAAWEPAGSEVIVRTDRTGRWRSKAINPHFESDFVGISRGDFPGKRPVFEQALAHFKTRMGRPAAETLWTQRGRDVALAMSGEEPRGFSLDHPGFGGLTFQRPPLCAGDPITGFAANGLPVFGVHVLPGTVRAVDYDHFPVSGEGRTYHDLSPGNAGAQYRADDVDIACGVGRSARAVPPRARRVARLHGPRPDRRQLPHRRALRGRRRGRRDSNRLRRQRRHRRRRAARKRRRLAHHHRRDQRRAAGGRPGAARVDRRRGLRLRPRFDRRRRRLTASTGPRGSPAGRHGRCCRSGPGCRSSARRPRRSDPGRTRAGNARARRPVGPRTSPFRTPTGLHRSPVRRCTRRRPEARQTPAC